MISLENDFLKIKAKESGGELVSILLKKDKIEYLWQANPEYWKFHAPICFPIVGKLIDDKYLLDDDSYKMTVHGFARDMIFDVLNVENDELSFKLKANNETLNIYPYDFELTIRYKLVKNTVIVSYEVKNNDDCDMYFSIGAHTAFNCPINNKFKFDDYYLYFDCEEQIEPFMLKNGQLLDKRRAILKNTKRLPISYDLFQDDVIILDNLKSKKVSIVSDKDNHSVTVLFDDFPYFAIWSKPTGAPFVCLEPWFGLPDLLGTSVQLRNKKGIQKLNSNSIFKCNYKIIIN